MDPTKALSEPCRDETYYFECITLQVENCLFQVPRNYFKSKSNVFESMLSLPQPEGDMRTSEGVSDGNPVRLEGVGLVDFKRLLEVMHPLDVVNRMPDDLTANLKVEAIEEWISVLKLSTMWHLYDIRALAIVHLNRAKMDAIDRVLLAREYSVPEWLQSAYQELMKRTVIMSFDDTTRVGRDTALCLYQGREEYSSKGTPLATIIDRVFGPELESIGAVSMVHTNGANDRIQQILGAAFKQKEVTRVNKKKYGE